MRSSFRNSEPNSVILVATDSRGCKLFDGRRRNWWQLLWPEDDRSFCKIAQQTKNLKNSVAVVLLCLSLCLRLLHTHRMVGGRRVDAWRQKKWKSENIENITNTRRTAESSSSKRIVESSSSCPLCFVKGRDHSTTLRSGVSGPSNFLLAIYSQKAILRFKSFKIKCFLKFSIARFWPKFKKSPDFYTWFK
jgi:hypothetical protein